MVCHFSVLSYFLSVDLKCTRTGVWSNCGFCSKKALSPYLIASSARGSSEQKMSYRHLALPRTRPPLTWQCTFRTSWFESLVSSARTSSLLRRVCSLDVAFVS